MKVAFLLLTIEDYGKLISYCIERDICVFRTYWDERKKDRRCYTIDWINKRCNYSDISYYEREGYDVVVPRFKLDSYGKYQME